MIVRALVSKQITIFVVQSQADILFVLGESEEKTSVIYL